MNRLSTLLLLGFCSTLPLSAQAKDDSASRREDATDYYRKWLEEDVLYIISEEEEGVFSKLSTEAERDAFIEQFWHRRDPDPRTAENEYKAEHYRRIQFANERYHAGIPGWKTDRGRIYIMFGPPDRKESYPNGGWYDRKDYEGGGSTSVYPFEIWEYRYLEGVGEEVELEFVDQSGANLYRLTTNAQDKDMFLTVPGSGLTQAEMFNPDFGGRKSPDRVLGIRENGQLPGIYGRTKDSPFAKTELLMRVSKAPAIRYDDLKALVDSSVTYNQLPFQASIDSVRVDSERALTGITITFPNSEVTFAPHSEGRRQSHLQIYGAVRSLNKRIVAEFDDDISVGYAPERLRDALLLTGIYQKKITLAPGRYRLDLILKDVNSDRKGTQAVSIFIPSAADDELSTSSLILTRNVEAVEGDLSQPFVWGNYKIRPQNDGLFPREGHLGFYFEIYGFRIDQANRQPALSIEYAVSRPGESPRFRKVRQGAVMAADRIYLARMVSLGDQEPGRRELICRVTDQMSGQSITIRRPFEVQ